MLGKPRIRLNNLKTSLRFPCLGLNPIIDSICPRNSLHHTGMSGYKSSRVSFFQKYYSRQLLPFFKIFALSNVFITIIIIIIFLVIIIILMCNFKYLVSQLVFMPSLFLIQNSECILFTQLSLFLWIGHGKLNSLPTFQRVKFGFALGL